MPSTANPTADLGWTILRRGDIPIKGDHGYDPAVIHPFTLSSPLVVLFDDLPNVQYPDMRAIFVARGPHFKSGVQAEQSFTNIEIYNMVAFILQLKPAINDGSLSNVRRLLK